MATSKKIKKDMMQLTNRSKVVSNKEMSFKEKLYIPAILSGMGVTFKHMFKKSVSLRYPEVTREFSPVYRGMHVLKRDEQGRENCTACGLCAVACPAEAITMDAAERNKGEENLYREEKYATKYEINMLRCIFCGLCEEACPKDAIYLSETFAPANFQRKGFIYGKPDLLIPHPVNEKEAFEKAKGGRVKIKN